MELVGFHSILLPFNISKINLGSLNVTKLFLGKPYSQFTTDSGLFEYFGANVLNKYFRVKHQRQCVSRLKNRTREARWPSGRASDSGARGRGFDPLSGRRVVSLSKIHLPPKKYW